MSVETLDNTLAFLKPLISEKCLFNFFGGEPLLRVDFVRDAAKKIRALYPKCRFHISTNMSVCSEEVIEFAKEYLGHCALQISYDGVDQEKHRGHSDLVRSNIKKCIERLGTESVTARLTYTRESIGNLYDSMVDIYELGFRMAMHSAEYMLGWTKEHFDAYEAQLSKIYEFVAAHPEFKVKFADCNLAVKKSSISKCGMGQALLSISSDGKIFPCHRAVAHPELSIGDVNAGKLNRGGFIEMNCDKCTSCEARNACHNCMISSYCYSKSLREPLECVCELNKIEFRKASEEYKKIHGDDVLADRALTSAYQVLSDVYESNVELTTLLKGITDAR